MKIFSRTLRFIRPKYEYFEDSDTLYIHPEGMAHWKSKTKYDILMDGFMTKNLFKVRYVYYIDEERKQHQLR